MIKKRQKWIALLVTLTFVWLLQASAMPVAAAGATGQLSSAAAERGPDYYEAAGHKPPRPQKRASCPGS